MTVVSVSPARPVLTIGQKIFLGFIQLMAFLPWLWLIGFGLLLWAAFIQTGGLPSYGEPDPKAISGWAFLVNPVLALFITGLASPLLMFLILLVAQAYISPARCRRVANFYLWGEVLFLLLPLAAVGSQMIDGDFTNVWLILLTVVPLFGVALLAAWEDILSFRWTRWMASGLVWGVAYALVAPFGLQLMTWLID